MKTGEIRMTFQNAHAKKGATDRYAPPITGIGKQTSKEEAEEVTTVDRKQFTPEDDIHKEEMNLKDEIV